VLSSQRSISVLFGVLRYIGLHITVRRRSPVPSSDSLIDALLKSSLPSTVGMHCTATRTVRNLVTETEEEGGKGKGKGKREREKGKGKRKRKRKRKQSQ